MKKSGKLTSRPVATARAAELQEQVSAAEAALEELKAGLAAGLAGELTQGAVLPLCTARFFPIGMRHLKENGVRKIDGTATLVGKIAAEDRKASASAELEAAKTVWAIKRP
jgi:hypothetical protein